MMGVWFLSTAIAELVAGQLAALTDRVARGELFHLFGGQADFYFMFVVMALAATVALAGNALAAPPDARPRQLKGQPN